MDLSSLWPPVYCSVLVLSFQSRQKLLSSGHENALSGSSTKRVKPEMLLSPWHLVLMVPHTQGIAVSQAHL